MSKWIRKGDIIKVIAGNSKGQQGTVLIRRGDKVVVEGVNQRVRYQKATKVEAGQRFLCESPLHISNVQLVNAEGVVLRPRVRMGQDGSRNLVAVVDGQETVLRVLRKAPVAS